MMIFKNLKRLHLVQDSGAYMRFSDAKLFFIAHKRLYIKGFGLCHVHPSLNLSIDLSVHLNVSLLVYIKPRNCVAKTRLCFSIRAEMEPWVVGHVKDVNVKEGHPAKFMVEYRGNPIPEVTWFKEELEIQTSTQFQIMSCDTHSYLFIPEGNGLAFVITLDHSKVISW